MIKKKKKTVRPKVANTAKRKPAAKRVKAKAAKAPGIMFDKIGEVTHYFGHVKAAAVKLVKGKLAIGDEIYIKGHTTDFKEAVRSIQLDHVSIGVGKKGQEIGLFVKSRVRIGDAVYKV